MTKDQAIISIAIGLSILMMIAFIVSLGWGMPFFFHVQKTESHSLGAGNHKSPQLGFATGETGGGSQGLRAATLPFGIRFVITY
jgi:hypothetical protein